MPEPDAANYVLPKGTVVAYWAKSGQVPNGWAPCDGANGTPDLRKRFVRGTADFADVGADGGSSGFHFAVPPHSHSLVEGQADKAMRAEGFPGVVNHRTAVNYLVNSYTDTVAGSNVDVKTEPPYVVLMYIMKL